MADLVSRSNGVSRTKTKLTRPQIIGFSAAFSGWVLDGMDLLHLCACFAASID